jgi:hypothetical protein
MAHIVDRMGGAQYFSGWLTVGFTRAATLRDVGCKPLLAAALFDGYHPSLAQLLYLAKTTVT